MLSVKDPTDSRKKNVDKFNSALSGIELTQEEEAALLWLSGWDYSTVDNIISVIKKVKNQAGQAETADRLYEALNTVREHCAKRGRACKGCLLNTDAVYGGCDFLDENPEDWDLGFLKGDTDGKS